MIFSATYTEIILLKPFLRFSVHYEIRAKLFEIAVHDDRWNDFDINCPYSCCRVKGKWNGICSTHTHIHVCTHNIN